MRFSALLSPLFSVSLVNVAFAAIPLEYSATTSLIGRFDSVVPFDFEARTSGSTEPRFELLVGAGAYDPDSGPALRVFENGTSDNFLGWFAGGSPPILRSGTDVLANYVTIADVDGDGLGAFSPEPYEDIVEVSNLGINWYRKDPISGAFGPVQQILASNDADFGGPHASAGQIEFIDIDDDGDQDIVLTSSNTWFRKNPAGTYTRLQWRSGFSAIASLHVADVNGDDDADLITTTREHWLNLYLFDRSEDPDNFGVVELLLDSSNQPVPLDFPDGYLGTYLLDTIDLDGDGDLELFVPGTPGWFNGTIAQGSPDDEPFDLDTFHTIPFLDGTPVLIHAVKLADIDGDGLEDLVASADGNLYVARRSGPTTFDPLLRAPDDGSGTTFTQREFTLDRRIHVRDINDDARPEIISSPLEGVSGVLPARVNVYRLPRFEVNLGDFRGQRSKSILESGGSQFARLRLEEPAPYDIRIQLDIIDGTAVQGVHFSIPPSETELEIPAGSTSANITIDAFDDDIYNERREFTIAILGGTVIGAPGAYVEIGDQETLDILIGNDDLVDIFITGGPELFVDEGAGQITIEVRAETTLTSFPNFVLGYESFAGFPDPTDASDLTYVSGTLAFSETNLVRTVVVPINDDSDPEANERFSFNLFPGSSPNPTRLIGAQTTVTIIDNDGPGGTTFADEIAADGVPPGSDGALDDASGDGYANVLLYGLGLNILNPDPFERSRRLMASVFAGTATFRIPEPARGDIRYIVEEQCDGGTWVTIATKVGAGPWMGPATVRLIPEPPDLVRVEVDNVGTGARCLTRLRVELLFP